MTFQRPIIQILSINLIYFLCIYPLYGQCDHTTNRYATSMESQVQYGISVGFDGQLDTLYMDIYKPVGDMNAERPLIIWCFGGGFFTGNRDDFAEICQEMAGRGYVAVTIDYRLGYVHPDGLPPPFAVDENELVRAAYRAMQDLKGAVRFMKNRAVQDSIDLEEVYVGGASAGAITALAATFIRDDGDIDQSIVGELPTTMTNPPVERPELGPVSGDLNLGGEDASVSGVVNIFGALFDVNQIRQSDDIAIYSYHQSGDPVVPCERDNAYWGVSFPGLSDNMPVGSGSCAITDRLEELNYSSSLYKTWIYSGNDHAIHNNTQVFVDIFEFLEDQICDEVSSVSGDKPLTWEAYPNPFSGDLNISGFSGSEILLIYDSMGHLVKRIKFTGSRLDLSELAPGQYSLLRPSTGEVTTIVCQ